MLTCNVHHWLHNILAFTHDMYTLYTYVVLMGLCLCGFYTIHRFIAMIVDKKHCVCHVFFLRLKVKFHWNSSFKASRLHRRQNEEAFWPSKGQSDGVDDISETELPAILSSQDFGLSANIYRFYSKCFILPFGSLSPKHLGPPKTRL